MTCLSHPTDIYLFKIKSTNTILICWVGSKSRIKTLELCHAVFIFNFEHIQQIHLISLLLTLNIYLLVGHKIKSTKQLKACVHYFNGIFNFSTVIALQKLYKCFLFHLKSSFRSWDIQIFVFLSFSLFRPGGHYFGGWSKINLKVHDVINCLNKN